MEKLMENRVREGYKSVDKKQRGRQQNLNFKILKKSLL